MGNQLDFWSLNVLREEFKIIKGKYTKSFNTVTNGKMLDSFICFFYFLIRAVEREDKCVSCREGANFLLQVIILIGCQLVDWGTKVSREPFPGNISIHRNSQKKKENSVKTLSCFDHNFSFKDLFEMYSAICGKKK